MEINTARYHQSAPSVEKCPPPDKPEFAFIGRSNVGKSSLINYITNKARLALTSSKPGKTKAINHFIINDKWYLVDLPGYGYAQISREQREKWLAMITDYLSGRKNLVNTFVLIDSSIPPQGKDIDFLNWMGREGIPFTILFTKADKAKDKDIERNIHDFQTKLLENWIELPPRIQTSVKSAYGKDEILGYIADCMKISPDFSKTK